MYDIETVQDLFQAAHQGHVQALQAALTKGDDNLHVGVQLEILSFEGYEWPFVNPEGCQDGDTLLHIAVRFRSSRMVDVLLDLGAESTTMNGSDISVLDLATDPEALQQCGGTFSDPWMDDVWNLLHVAPDPNVAYTLMIIKEDGEEGWNCSNGDAKWCQGAYAKHENKLCEESAHL